MRKKYDRNLIIKLNQVLREKYSNAGADKIRHRWGNCSDMTCVRVDRMPNTNKPGWIFAGYTDDLLEQL